MENYLYREFNRAVYRETLANGLRVELMPMTGFNKTYAIMTTDFGSIDNHFIPYQGDEPVWVPDGTAHFLEHKLFEKRDYDAFDLFGELGADSNAFTSFTQTSYLFSTTSHLHENLDVLLDFVQEPYFTEQMVAKEQGIIGQEIQMYNDDPSWRLYLGMLGNLYPHDPMRVDIAGTVESISQITPATLMECYQTFYQPSNMTLLLAGKLNPAQVMAWVKTNQERRSFVPQKAPQRLFELNDATGHDVIPFRSLTMNVSRPKIMVGVRGTKVFTTGHERLKHKLAVDLLLDLLLDDTSANYLRLYDQGIIDDSFGYSYDLQRGFAFAAISTNTDRLEDFADEIMAILEKADQELNQAAERFAGIKRAELGRLISLLDSPEAVGNRYAGRLYDNANLMDEIRLLREIELADLHQAANDLLAPQAMSVYQVVPQHQ
ncbi:EF-P 5-aminopentanol modification-associated protein YfmH [Limosilactobacillus antri]|uniref:M16 family peptidase n=1 Tax=Limosilactobacillus antri DSM 16041 TaxID=525309 RepID=C8P751_9LACO|nr:pitrilysin family protein [Limosilactobacillus antri]EEW53711.1 peptidase M16 inactive domain protein [Limosilactobacillus antri DSM 16041]KRK60092.1 M16 family peptidase [Limosilactobacillus antri DSM 16041]